MIGLRPLRVQHLKETQKFPDCQILFIGAVEKTRIATFLAGLRGIPVLTVGDSEHFVNQGGVIGFCLEEKRFALKSTWMPPRKPN
jgi:hypothetical protein